MAGSGFAEAIFIGHTIVSGGVGEAANLSAVGRRGRITDREQKRYADAEEQNGEVEKVHRRQPLDGARQGDAARRHHFDGQAESAQQKADYQRGDRASRIDATAKYAEEEDRRNGWSDIRLNALQIDIELIRQVGDEGNPEDAEQHQNPCEEPSRQYQFFLGGLRL